MARISPLFNVMPPWALSSMVEAGFSTTAGALGDIDFRSARPVAVRPR